MGRLLIPGLVVFLAGSLTAAQAVFAPKIPAACPRFPALNGPGVLCEDFDTERNGVPGFQFTRLPIGISALDPLLAYGDPDDDVLGYAQTGGAIPPGTGARTCATGQDSSFSTCSAAVAEENDWHLHSPTEGPGAGYDPPDRPGIGAPDGGKAHSGARSVHWGRHTDPSSTLGDTSRFRQISAFVLDPAVNLGPDSTMEFWHIISVPDDETTGGFLAWGRSFGGGQVQISLMGANGRFQRWRRINASVNGYDSTTQETVSICEFDPGDDRDPPADDSMCDSNPLWADIGDVIGTDATCLIDTDGNDRFHNDCGDTSSRGPGFTETGALGTGVWAKSVFDLSPFAGRRARLRFIGSEGGGWSFGADRSFLEPTTGISYQYFDTDDGWWIDDIVLTDLRTAPSACVPDGDGDGVPACDGDCDDSNPAIYPGAPGPCDGLSNNCDAPDWPALNKTEEVDDDFDGYSECQGDCDDRRASVRPGAPEICDGRYNNCSDPGWLPGTPPAETDADTDGYRICNGDCDDTNPAIFPAAYQQCDGINNDCSDPAWPTVPAGELDADSDSYRGCGGDCDDTRASVRPGGPQICDDRLNNDCSHLLWPSLAHTNESDDDRDGFTECQEDCVDSNAAAWARPAEARDLVFALDGRTISWLPPAAPGGNVIRYDVIRSPLGVEIPPSQSTCVVTDGVDSTAVDPIASFTGVLVYVVRAENLCPGALGIGVPSTSSSGIERPARTCP